MRLRIWSRVLLPLALVVALGSCREYPTKPVGWLANHNPVISSVVAFPQLIGQGDSVMVTVNATDPDGDTLVYDWQTDARLHMRGDDLGFGDLSNTYSNSLILYRTTVTPINDTAWVYCDVRDRRGGGAGRLVLIPIRN
jgi:hypothetical protein